MRERLGPSDWRFLLVCLVVLVLTVWFSARFFYRAFPEASIDFVVTREQARAVAEQFLRSLGGDPGGRRLASRFSFDGEAKTFLEREVGLAEANRLMERQVRLWRWSYRWFRPLEKEEYRVEITPRGEAVGFQHLLPEQAPGADLPAERARALAEAFLRDKMRREPETLDFVEASSARRPARVDHVLTWKERGFQLREATYRIEVTVAGDRLGGYREYLKLPEAWRRDYERLRSRNDTAQTVDSGLTVLLVVGLLATLVSRLRRRDVRWRRCLGFGAAGGALFFLSSWNSHPLAEFGYPTTDSYGSFLATRLLGSVLGGLASGGLLVLLTAAAEPLYREWLGGRVSLGQLFRWRGVRTKSFLLGSALGVTLTGVFVAYQIAFYLAAYRLGAWSPADVPYDDLLNTRFPWLFVLLGGFFPAVSEEFLFRMFAIPFLAVLLGRARWRWLPGGSLGPALLVAGFLWGFGHSAYPQQPFYIRGVEVGIGGVALGLVMLRWGILPTLVWHYSVDALYTALLLLRSNNLYFILSGAACAGLMLAPLLAAWIAYWRGKGFEPESELINEREGTAPPAAEEPAPAAAELPYQGWSARRRAVAVAIPVAAAVVWMLAPVESYRFSDFARTAPEARAAADAFLRERGLRPESFRAVAYPENEFSRASSCCGPGTRPLGKYFLERRPPRYLEEAARRHLPLHSWAIRYYKPLEKEEARVWVNPGTGGVIGFEHRLPEDQAGADLPAENAHRIAAAFLSARGLDLGSLESKETTSEKKKARRDHVLVWEARPGDGRNLEEARYRARVEVAGDRVVSLRTLWKLPEAYLRERARLNALSILLLALRTAAIGAFSLAGLWILVQRTRRRQLRWRPVLAIALSAAGLGVLGSVSSLGLQFRNYSTAIPLEAFQVTLAVGLLVGGVGIFLGAAWGAGLLLALRPEALEALRRQNRRRLVVDALLAVAAGAGLAVGVNRLRGLLLGRFHTLAFVGEDSPDLFAAAAPALSAVAGAALEALLFAAALAVVAGMAARARGRWWLGAPLALAAVAALVPDQVHTGAEFALHYGLAIVSAGLLVGWAAWFGRDNYLAYALLVWGWSLGSPALELLSQSAPWLRQQGWVIAGVMVLTAAWAVAPRVYQAHEAHKSGAGC